jgi:hypothetical protein
MYIARPTACGALLRPPFRLEFQGPEISNFETLETKFEIEFQFAPDH